MDDPPQRAAPDAALPPEDRLSWAIDGLRQQAPDLSAYQTTTRDQKVAVGVAVVVLVVARILLPRIVDVTLVGVLIAIYLATIVMRLWLMRMSLKPGGSIVISDAEARSIADAELPRYSVLVPAYREPEVVGHLVDALDALDYPRDRLEVLLLLEADDLETIEAARAAGIGDHVRIVEIPPSEPRTKPKALNYALLEATGEFVTVYDAEDRPEPLQLRRAAIALRRGSDRLACLQAHLNYFNPDQNAITRWFTLEYTTWFTQFLPGLIHAKAPIPLGGTSNHFRREVLIDVGGWDPYNVTEDADLGLRFYRLGYEVGVLKSVTLEEANSDFINWVKQRSRWYKGYLQTWLLHLRHPVRACRSMGWRSFLIFNFFVGGTPALALLNPIFWAMAAIWFTVHPAYIADLFPPATYYFGLTCWILGNFFLLYAFLLTALTEERVSLVRSALLMPIYFVMMSLAAYKALIQLVFTPSYWEKTTHGLDVPAVASEASST